MQDKIIIKEVLRYINVPYEKADDEIKMQIQATYKELKDIADIRYTYQKFALEKEAQQIGLKDTSLQIMTSDLSRVLKNCDEVYVLAATLGTQVDKKISAIQQTDMLKALLFNACANVLTESACDQVEREIMESLSEDRYLTMRYSPGYGDVPLNVQPELLRVLDTARKIGLTTTKAGMLLPIKSVTAFIGLSSIKEDRQKGCGECLIQGVCAYRRRGEKCGS